MNPRSLLLASVTLVLAAPAAAQPAPADPISGTWVGDMAPSGVTNRQPITIELKLDGRNLTGTVTGPPQPGTIRTGTFDAATGALHVEVAVQGSDGAPFVFDGTVVTGTALGRVTGGGVTGDFKIAKQTATGGTPPAGATDSVALALRFGFTQLSDWVTRAAEMVPAERYDYRPAPTVRTFGELVAHVADGSLYYCGVAEAGRSVQWTDAIAKGSTDKATVMRELARTLGACSAVYEKGGSAAPLMQNIAHTSLHYGNMVTYLRMLGLVPPSS